VSVLTTPSASAIIIAELTRLVINKVQKWILDYRAIFRTAMGFCLAVLFFSGLAISKNEFAAAESEKELPVMNYVKAHKESGDLYLIPVEMQKFRLYSGAAVFVDWKTHPYKDKEILEWHQRLKIAERIYKGKEIISDAAWNKIIEEKGISYIVFPSERKQEASEKWEELYSDDDYSLFTVK